MGLYSRGMARNVMRAGNARFTTHTRRYAKRIKLEWASDMRRNPTKGEAVIWELVRMGRLGFKFRRQAIVRGYIVDFWCPKVRLVVEIDGGYHQTSKQREWDRTRDAVLASIGIETLRLPDAQVREDPQAASSVIFQVACRKLRELENARREVAGRASSEAACSALKAEPN